MDSLTTSEPRRTHSGSPTSSFLVALLAAGAGALVWGAVSFFTGYEVGYVAWGIGGLVGLAMARFGGRGVAGASTAAILTVAGIAGGKLLATRFVVEKELSEGLAQVFSPELHQELVRDAADFSQLDADPSDEDLRLFMVEHGFTGAGSPEAVKDGEVDEFLASTAPELRSLYTKRLSYDAWFAKHEAESRQAFEESFSIVQANIDELNGIDLLFVVLGVSTAFGIVRRASTVEPPAGDAPAAAPQEFRRAA